MKFGRYILVFGFLLIIFSFGTLSLLADDREISMLENRTLAQKPVMDAEFVWSGEYFKQYETYFTDQFISRDEWVKYYTKLQMETSSTYVNGFYITEDNYILKQPSMYFPQKEIEVSTSNLNNFAEYLKDRNIDFYYFSLPSKENTLTGYLPSYVPEGTSSKNKQYFLSLLNREDYRVFDMQEVFEKDAREIKDLYFQTDHHWNMDGAFLGYQTMIEVISKDHPDVATDYEKSNFDKSCLEAISFVGSWNKQLSMQVDNSEENICYYQPKHYSFDDYDVYVSDVRTEHKANHSDIYASILNEDNKDKESVEYGHVYSGDYAEINILNPKSTNDLKVLIVKDSYVNTLGFHLAHHFKETTLYDLRYNPDRTVYEYIEQHDFDIVMVAYNDQNIYSVMFNFDQLTEQ